MRLPSTHRQLPGASWSYELGLLALAALLLIGCSAHDPASGFLNHRQEEARQRARDVEEARVQALVLAAQQEGRGPGAEDSARGAEVERAKSYVLGVASGARSVGAELTFTFWVQQGALTLVGYHAEDGGERTARPVDGEELARELRLVLTEHTRRHTGEVVLTLKREETRHALGSSSRGGTRPPEARTLPVPAQGMPSSTFLALHEAATEWLRTVQIPPGGALRVEYAVHLEDGRLGGWELLESQRTREGHGGPPSPLAAEVVATVTRVLLPFTEGLGARTVHLVLQTEHRMEERQAWGWVESARVERAPLAAEQSWYRAMHEATLLRWREGVIEGSSWLAQQGAEELTFWLAGGIATRGLGPFVPKALKAVRSALGRSPEPAAGWLRSALTRLPGEQRKAFEQLWSKVLLEGEKSLTRSERKRLRGLMEGIEQLVKRPLDIRQKKLLRAEARDYYKRLHPEFASFMDPDSRLYPIHHRRPLEYAHCFPAEDINAAENLILVRDSVHTRINAIWTKLRTRQATTSAQDVEQVARLIDKHFEARWYNRPDLPQSELPLLDDARDAAMKDLLRLFPDLK